MSADIIELIKAAFLGLLLVVVFALAVFRERKGDDK